MLLLGACPTDRGILAATLAIAAVATLVLTAGYAESGGSLLSDAPAAIIGAEATAGAPAPAPAPARRPRDAAASATVSTAGDPRGVALYLLIEAARPQPHFTR